MYGDGITVPSDTTQFVSTPGEVAFTPDGSRLIVTTKASGSDIDVFRVGPFGYLSPSPVVNAEPGNVPFAVTFDPVGHVVVADAGTNAVSTYSLTPDGMLSSIATVATGQSATCWITSAQGAYFASNAGSATISGFAEQVFSGQLSLLGATPTDAGTKLRVAGSDPVFRSIQAGQRRVDVQIQTNAIRPFSPVGPNGRDL